jgi:hypothetical protein
MVGPWLDKNTEGGEYQHDAHFNNMEAACLFIVACTDHQESVLTGEYLVWDD